MQTFPFFLTSCDKILYTSLLTHKEKEKKRKIHNQNFQNSKLQFLIKRIENSVQFLFHSIINVQTRARSPFEQSWGSIKAICARRGARQRARWPRARETISADNPLSSWCTVEQEERCSRGGGVEVRYVGRARGHSRSTDGVTCGVTDASGKRAALAIISNPLPSSSSWLMLTASWCTVLFRNSFEGFACVICNMVIAYEEEVLLNIMYRVFVYF